MSIYGNNPFAFAGVNIIASEHMVDVVEDWSEVRSPSRARRRRERGFPQRIKITHVPKTCAYAMDGGRTMVMHPEMLKAVQIEFAKDEELRQTEKFLRERGLLGGDMSSPWAGYAARPMATPMTGSPLGYFFNGLVS